jgi:hypothetical protein
VVFCTLWLEFLTLAFPTGAGAGEAFEGLAPSGLGPGPRVTLDLLGWRGAGAGAKSIACAGLGAKLEFVTLVRFGPAGEGANVMLVRFRGLLEGAAVVLVRLTALGEGANVMLEEALRLREPGDGARVRFPNDRLEVDGAGPRLVLGGGAEMGLPMVIAPGLGASIGETLVVVLAGNEVAAWGKWLGLSVHYRGDPEKGGKGAPRLL